MVDGKAIVHGKAIVRGTATAYPGALTVNNSNSTTMAPMIEVSGVSKWFGDFRALADVSVTIAPGEKVVVCGPSGSGKSTLIRCI